MRWVYTKDRKEFSTINVTANKVAQTNIFMFYLSMHALFKCLHGQIIWTKGSLGEESGVCSKSEWLQWGILSVCFYRALIFKLFWYAVSINKKKISSMFYKAWALWVPESAELWRNCLIFSADAHPFLQLGWNPGWATLCWRHHEAKGDTREEK